MQAQPNIHGSHAPPMGSVPNLPGHPVIPGNAAAVAAGLMGIGVGAPSAITSGIIPSSGLSLSSVNIKEEKHVSIL